MARSHFQFQYNYKKLGHLTVGSNQLELINHDQLGPYIKILLVPQGYNLKVDFNLYISTCYTLFFIAPNQSLSLIKGSGNDVQLIYYNRDFYCVQMHDAEVACDGLLFNNIFELPKVTVDSQDQATIENLFQNIRHELQCEDTSSEEMIRTYLKQIIILSTRSWKRQNLEQHHQAFESSDKELFRDFGRLVDIHYKEKHSVNDYAELLHLTPKTLANKFHKLHLANPNDIIKKRIVLEAKRLLYYTELNVKEIAYQLGYEDPAYFNRLFNQKAGASPVEFRKGMKT